MSWVPTTRLASIMFGSPTRLVRDGRGPADPAGRRRSEVDLPTLALWAGPTGLSKRSRKKAAAPAGASYGRSQRTSWEGEKTTLLGLDTARRVAAVQALPSIGQR